VHELCHFGVSGSAEMGKIIWLTGSLAAPVRHADQPALLSAASRAGLSEHAVDRTPSDAETLRDRRGSQFGPQLPNLRRIDADRAPLVFAGGLRLGDALAATA
jgi:hypothetical protein